MISQKLYGYLILVAIALVSATASVATAQAEEAPTGALYLTSTALESGGTCGASGQGATIPWYEMSDQKPAPGKTYTGISAGGLSCSFNFEYTATQDSVLTGDFVVFLQIGCDVAGQAIELDYNFLVAGESVSGLVRPAVDYLCTGSSSEFTYEQTFEADDVPVATGDVMTLTLNLFAAAQGPAPASNWHIKTGHETTPSGVFGAGLPGGAPVAVPEVFNLTGPAETLSAGPNETFDVPITIENGGSANASYAINASNVPDGFSVAFDAPEGIIAAGESTNVTASVTIPAAPPGEYAFDAVVSGPNGGNATMPIAFSVADDTTEPSGPSGPLDSANATGANETDASGDDSGGVIPGLGVTLVMGVVLTMAMVLTRRRLA